MEYYTLNISQAEEMISEELELEKSDGQGNSLIPVSSTYEYVEGAEDSPYIITSSTY